MTRLGGPSRTTIRHYLALCQVHVFLVRYGAPDPIRMRFCLTAYQTFPPQSRMASSTRFGCRNAGSIRIDERPRACNNLKFDWAVIFIHATSPERSVPCTRPHYTICCTETPGRYTPIPSLAIGPKCHLVFAYRRRGLSKKSRGL